MTSEDGVVSSQGSAGTRWLGPVYLVATLGVWGLRLRRRPVLPFDLAIDGLAIAVALAMLLSLSLGVARSTTTRRGGEIVVQRWRLLGEERTTLRRERLRGVCVREGWWFRRVVLVHEGGAITVVSGHRWQHFGGYSPAAIEARARGIASVLGVPLLA